MIRLISGSHRADFPREIAAMHEIRKHTFHDRLGWQVKTLRSWEIDEFDALNPLYFLGAGVMALLIAGVTVYANTLRLARTNPVRSLRYE